MKNVNLIKNAVPISIKISVGLLLAYSFMSFAGLSIILFDPGASATDSDSTKIVDIILHDTFLGLPVYLVFLISQGLTIVSSLGLFFLKKWAYQLLIGLLLYNLITTIIGPDTGIGVYEILIPLVLFTVYKNIRLFS